MTYWFAQHVTKREKRRLNQTLEICRGKITSIETWIRSYLLIFSNPICWIQNLIYQLAPEIDINLPLRSTLQKNDRSLELDTCQNTSRVQTSQVSHIEISLNVLDYLWIIVRQWIAQMFTLPLVSLIIKYTVSPVFLVTCYATLKTLL